jgi:rod shape-determining protein MreC
MQQLLYFIKKFRYSLLFILLEILALFFTIQHHSYHSSRFISSANFITGGVYNKVNNIQEYFLLKNENKLLIEENIRLKNQLNNRIITNPSTDYSTISDTVKYFQQYEYSSAKVINNNFTHRNNILTINKGSNQGVETDFGIINSNGIIGVVKNVSPNFSTILSILNNNSRINIRLKNSNHYGTLIWNGNDYRILQITDIPRQALIKEGDTIITGGKSAIFPEGIPIGTIKDFKFENNKYNEINVSLFNDMSSIGYIQIIKNLKKNEQLILEQHSYNE